MGKSNFKVKALYYNSTQLQAFVLSGRTAVTKYYISAGSYLGVCKKR